MIRTVGLVKDYQTGAGVFHALRGVDLDISPGEFVAVMGPSGSGKSTFMNLLGCLDKPTSGHYELAGRAVSEMGRDELAAVRNKLIGFVFQGFNLLPRMSVADNVALPMLYGGASHAKRRERAESLLERVGLAGKNHQLPHQLSGGQQQRVAIARALVNQPKLISGGRANRQPGFGDQSRGDEAVCRAQPWGRHYPRIGDARSRYRRICPAPHPLPGWQGGGRHGAAP